MTTSTRFEPRCLSACVSLEGVVKADFLVDLTQMLGRGVSEGHRNLSRFFVSTRVTRGFKNRLASVCRRLSATGCAQGAILRLESTRVRIPWRPAHTADLAAEAPTPTRPALPAAKTS